jgi:multiple sugar transport system substrate-binding protein
VATGRGAGAGGRKTLTVWTIEDVADRVQATKRLTQQFTGKTGIKINLVAVAEDQFDQLVTSAAAAKKLPDVVAALSLAGVRSLDASQLLNTDIAGSVVRDLGEDSFAKRALELTRDGDRQLSVPSDGWAQLLVPQGPLRQGRPGTADELRRHREGSVHTGHGRHGRHHARHGAG